MRYSQEDAAKWLVEQGIEKEQCDKNGWTPIFCAVNAKNIPLVHVCLRVPPFLHFFPISFYLYFMLILMKSVFSAKSSTNETSIHH